MAWTRFSSLGNNLFVGAALLGLGASLNLAQTEPPRPSAHFANLEGIRVHYSDYGQGEFALLFVHGWNCDESVWRSQSGALAAKMRVLTVDLPGHGQSDKPEIEYTMDLHARAIDAVLEDAGLKSAVLVGHSNGTPVIRQFYRRSPEKVKGLVIVDGTLRPFGDAAVMEKFIAPLRGRDYERTATRFISGMTAPMKHARQREQTKTMMLRTPQQVAVSEMEGLRDPALWTEDKIDVPVLMILAKQPAWTQDYREFAHSLIPKLDYQAWPDVSHFLMMDRPNEFNRTLVKFLKRNQLVEER